MKESELEREAARQLEEAGFFVQQQATFSTVGHRTVHVDVVAWAPSEDGELAPDLVVEVKKPTRSKRLKEAAGQLGYYLPLTGASRGYVFDGSWHLVGDDFEGTTEVAPPQPARKLADARAPTNLITQLLWKSFDSMRSRSRPEDAWRSILDSLSTGEDTPGVDPQLLKLAATTGNGPRIADAFMGATRRLLENRSAIGEWTTPVPLAQALVRLLAAKPGWKVADPFCGIGTILHAVHEYIAAQGTTTTGELTGGEANKEVAESARKLLALAGVPVTIRVGNALDQMPVDNLDGVVTAPPMGTKLRDARPLSGGGATRSLTALVLDRVLASLRDGGRAVVLIPPGFLFRSGSEEEFRRTLASRARIVSVIELPPRLLFATGISCAVVVLEKHPPTDTLVARLEDDWELQLSDEGDFMREYRQRLEARG